MLNDIRLALRSLAKSPGFTAVAVLSLALGIGANTSIFSLVNDVLLKTLPVAEPHRLVLFEWAARDGVGPRSISGWTQLDENTGETTSTSFSVQTFEQIRANSAETMSEVFLFTPLYRTNVIVDGSAEVIAGGLLVSGNYHTGLGVAMAAGRGFVPDDDNPSAPPVAVISYDYWQRRFSGAPEAIGKTIRLDQLAATIIGVTAREFPGTQQVGEKQDFTVPMAFSAQLSGDNSSRNSEPWYWWVRIMGRLKPGITIEQARASVENAFRVSIKDTLSTRGGIEPAPAGAAVISLEDKVRLRATSGSQGLVEARQRYAKSLRIMASLVGLVLIVACANVANLLLARGAARRREIAVRLALGASRSRLLRQLLTESITLGLLGGLAGLLLAYWSRDLLLMLQPLGRSGLVLDLGIDLRILGFATGISILTGVLFGVVPAIRATRLDLSAEFQGSARTLGGSKSRFAQGLMVVQVALSFVLLVGAGLFTRTLINIQNVETGFDRSGLLLFSVDTSGPGKQRHDVVATYARIDERLAALPNVRNSTFTRSPILAGARWTSGVRVPGHTAEPGRNNSVVMNGIQGDFFATYGIALLDGRAFDARDEFTAPKVAIVNQTFAKKYFGNESAIGRRFTFGGPDDNTEFEIVGVARDTKYYSLKESPGGAVYLPITQMDAVGGVNFALRISGDISAVSASVQAAVKEIDPALPIYNLRTQEEQIHRMLAPERLFARLSGFFGIVAMLLAAIGLYGLLSWTILRRTGEIGLRMALGAIPARVLWMVLRESLAMVGIGVAIGIASAIGASRLIASQLFGLSPADPATYGMVAVMLVGVAVLASLIPARRAARTDPMVALRTE